MALPQPTDQPVRWGVLGCGRLADTVARDLVLVPGQVITAVAPTFRSTQGIPTMLQRFFTSFALVLTMTCALVAADTQDISTADLEAAIAAKTVTLLDANGSTSYATGHIPGAVDFTLAKADLAKALPTDKKALIVAYCGGPQCHAYQAAVTAAEQLGYTNIKHYSQGLRGWKKEGKPVATP